MKTIFSPPRLLFKDACCLILFCLSLLVSAVVPANPLSGLTSDIAADRSARLRSVEYQLAITLDASSEKYTGRVDIRFSLSDASTDLLLDASEIEVYGQELNGTDIEVLREGPFLRLPAASLRQGDNLLAVAYANRWSPEGKGLYRFKDPLDGKDYFYSHFSEWNANRVFPSFDQPDLKAPLTLSVTAPARWEIIASSSIDTTESFGDRKRWSFLPTKPISTYTMALHGGEFSIFESSKTSAVPMRLLVRQSLAAMVPKDQWFQWTIDGMNFFEHWFGVPFQFLKYDQVIVPDLQVGAMENVAAVTFSETLIGTGVLSEAQRETLANVILHELAHMWFGNLVTPRWWDDLWLNESFATFMATTAMAAITEFNGAWTSFLYNDKMWAYQQDALVTTHPIVMPVNDVLQAGTMFDDISYGKGAAVLKQLAFMIGEDRFKDAIARYVASFGGSNAALGDFLTVIPFESEQVRQRWADDWLRSAGFNAVKATRTCKSDKLIKIRIDQDRLPLRPHSLKLAIYQNNDAEPMLLNNIVIEHRTTEIDVKKDVECLALIFLNHGDQAYFVQEFSETDLNFFETVRMQFGDTMTRASVWNSLWMMTLDAHLPLARFLALAYEGWLNETDIRSISALNRYMRMALQLALTTWPNGAFPDSLTDALRKIEQGAWVAMTAGLDDQRLTLALFDLYVGMVHTQTGLERLQRLLDAPDSTIGFSLDASRRWHILGQLAAWRFPGTKERLKEELRKDGSALALQSSLSIRASLADGDGKKQMIDQLIAEGGTSTANDQAIINGLYPLPQRRERDEIAPLLIDSLPRLDRARSPEFMNSYVSALIPFDCDRDSSQIINDLLATATELKLNTQDSLRVLEQSNRRCRAIAALEGG